MRGRTLIVMCLMQLGVIATAFSQTRPESSGPATQPSTRPYDKYIDTFPNMIMRVVPTIRGEPIGRDRK